MNYLNKKTKLKIMSQILLGMTVTGVGANILLDNPVQLYANNKNDIKNNVSQNNTLETELIESYRFATRNGVFMKDGKVYAWGNNGNYQVAKSGSYMKVPTELDISNTGDSKVKSVGTNGSTTLILKEDGTVWGRGSGIMEELGFESNSNYTEFTQVPISDVEKMYNGGTTNIFIKKDGTVWACGQYAGPYVTATLEQINISDVKDVSIVSSATSGLGQYQNIYFLKNDGTVWAYGYNRLSLINDTNKEILAKDIVQLPITDVDKLSHGANGNCQFFIKRDGSIVANGYNKYGQLGTGSASSSENGAYTNVPIDNVSEIYTGANYTIFLKQDGSAYACGLNDSGQLGLKSTTNQTIPTKVPIANIKKVLAGIDSTTFITENNGIIRVGKNNVGQIGNNSTTTAKEHVQVASMWINETSYTLNKVNNNLDTYGKYGSLSSTIYGVSKYDTDILGNNLIVTYDKSTSSKLSTVSPYNEEIRISEVLPNGSMVTIDDYGSVQFYSTGTSSPIDIQVDGTAIDSIEYGMLDQTPVCLFYKNDGSIWYFEPTGTTISLKMLPIEQSEINGTTPYLDKNAQIQYFLFEKADGELVYFDTNRFEQSTGINMNDVQAVVPSTSNNSTMYLMKDGKLKYLSNGTATDVTLPDSLSITSMMSNRFFTMSDGYVYAINNNAIVETGVLASATQNACNNILWMKNGQMRTMDTTGTLSTLSDVNGKLVKTIVPFDNNNAYILNKDDSTYGVGNLVATTDLLNNNIDYDEIAGFISNNTNSKDCKLLVMKDGTVYENPSSWTKSIQIHFDGEALLEIQDTFEVSFDMLSQATSAVITAEKTKLQDNLDYAQSLVSALEDSSEKTTLQARLDVLQELINKIAEATKEVEKAEASKSAIDKEEAQKLVTALPDCTQKTELQERLNAIVTEKTPLEIATDLVEIAEGSLSQDDLDEARDKVNALPDGTEKDDLISRLDKVQAEIDKAQQEVDNLKDATDSVEKAEGSLSQDDLDDARDKVNNLPDGTEKDDLIDRLDKVQEEINNTQQEADNLKDAIAKVEKAESTLSKDDVDIAQSAIDKLPDGTDKDELQDRLDKVKEEIAKNEEADRLEALIKDATEKVEKVENTKSKVDVSSAQSAINKLPDGTIKDDLQNRLDKIKQEIADKEEQDKYDKLLDEAIKAMEKAESTKNTIDINKAQSAINKLPNGDDKNNLQERLDKLKAQIEEENKLKAQLTYAEQLVGQAERMQTSNTLNTAKDYVNTLPDGNDKTALLNRLQTVEDMVIQKENASKFTYATQLVEQAERRKTQTTINKARDYVNTLPDCSAKTELLNRLNRI